MLREAQANPPSKEICSHPPAIAIAQPTPMPSRMSRVTHQSLAAAVTWIAALTAGSFRYWVAAPASMQPFGPPMPMPLPSLDLARSPVA